MSRISSAADKFLARLLRQGTASASIGILACYWKNEGCTTDSSICRTRCCKIECCKYSNGTTICLTNTRVCTVHPYC